MNAGFQKYFGLLIFVGLIQTFSICVFSQSLQFLNYTTKDGLSNDKVDAIIQDRYGFIWIGTEDGLDRYDGYQFKVFRNVKSDSNSLSDNNIWALLEDQSGNIWIGTKSGFLNKYDQHKNVFTKWNLKSVGIKENGITSIFQDQQKNIWVGTYQNGLYRLNVSENKLNHWLYVPEDSTSLSNNYVTSIMQDSRGSIWVGTFSGLNKINPGAESVKFDKYFNDPSDGKSLPGNLVWSVSGSTLRQDKIWVCTADGLSLLNPDENSFILLPLPSKTRYQFGNSISSLVEEKNDIDSVLWIGTYSGLVRMNLKTNSIIRFLKNEDEPGSLISNQINHLLKDRSGVIWIATENGVSKISPKNLRFNNLFSDSANTNLFSKLYGKSVKAIAKDNKDKIYFGTEKGVISFNSLNNHIINKYPQTADLNVWSLTTDEKRNLWIGTYGQGLKYLDIQSGKITDINIESPTFKTSAYDYIKSLQMDGDDLWIGFWGGGLALLNTISGKYKVWINDVNDPNSISYNDVWAILKDSRKRIWIGTDGGGLNLVGGEAGLFENSGEVKFYKPLYNSKEKIELSSNSIYIICEARNYSPDKNKNLSILWIGTSSGLDKVVIINDNDGKNPDSMKFEISSFLPGNQLTDNSVNNILEDKNGNLWLSTSSGISFFDVRRESFINYSDADGLIGEVFNSNASIISGEGIIYFGSIGGINFFNPDQITLSSYTPPVLIADFQIFNEAVKTNADSPLSENIYVAKSLNLYYSQNVFSFQLAALDYNYPQSIQYAYKMEGFDKDWIYSGNRRFITYTNLGSGSYSFKFKATNCDGVWNENYSSVIVNISPPWWRTVWSYIIYILLIISGIFALRRFEINRTKLRNELKMQEFEAKKQRELEIMKSRFFANLSHEFRTPLTLIMGPVEELMNNRVGENVQEYYQIIHRNSEKLQVLIDQLLELTRLENAAIPLKAKREDLIKVLRGIFFSFDSIAKQKNINLTFYSYSDSIFCWFDRDKLEKIINNLLFNAFKFTPDNGTIKLEIKNLKEQSDEFARVKIIDNGIGISDEKLEKIFDRFYQADDSSVKNYGGSGIGLALVKELVDLHKWQISVQSKLGAGTEFSLIIPLSEIYLKESEKEPESVRDNTIDKISGTDVISNEQTELNEREIEKEIEEKNRLLSAKPLILIVEDSEDVRSYLKSFLRNNYRVSEVINGEEGLTKSAELVPDLIISDVMMPLMDGMEFCRKIKTDLQTSHIPVILLTARASTESKLEGLETGADDYFTKPFSSKELLVRIKNLLEQRKNLREKFSKEIKIDLSSVAVTSLDNEFLRKAFDVAEKNLSDTEFNTEAFAGEMFLSRSQFHRKLIAVTGQGPGEFLRTIRLKRAAALILENRLSITQISFEVGFNNPSHFAKAFRQLFNCLPTEFINKSNS